MKPGVALVAGFMLGTVMCSTATSIIVIGLVFAFLAIALSMAAQR